VGVALARGLPQQDLFPGLVGSPSFFFALCLFLILAFSYRTPTGRFFTIGCYFSGLSKLLRPAPVRVPPLDVCLDFALVD